MPVSTIITGALIDLAKKELIKAGKKVAHELLDSAAGIKVGQIICYRKEEGYNNVILFVHGFSGNSSQTFGVTPELLEGNPQFAGWDIFSIGYSSDIFPAIGKGLWSVNPDIGKISQYLRTLLQNQFSEYDRIAFVAHSMGGLAVQRAILDLPDDDSKKITHVLMFGTPSAGLKKAFWVRFWNRQLHDLSNESDFIKKLRGDWNQKFPNPGFRFKTIAGSKDEFVTVDSSLHPFDEQYRGVIEGNHVNMIKPKNKEDIQHQSYQIILKTLTNENVVYLNGDPEEVNLLLGEYQRTINKYFKKAKEIGVRELIQLVFALECTGKHDEAVSVLREHPKANSNSDLLGILGGRFKRKYLLEGLQADLDSALDYYSRALAIAQEAEDASQIFYHSINLAFLSLVANNNRADMQKYARLALDHCKSGEGADLWETATIAEANLYLENITQSDTYYRKAGKIAGNDIRSKQSIYSNAYYGYQSLMSSRNTEADFIKMLEEVFLENEQ